MTTLVTAQQVNVGGSVLGNAILIERGRVSAVGEAELLRNRAETVIDHGSGFIFPGFRDAHMHAVPYASLLSGCSLKSATSIDDLVQRLADHASSLDATQPVVATRLDDESLAEVRLPTRHDLDRAVPDRPAVIYR